VGAWSSIDNLRLKPRHETFEIDVKRMALHTVIREPVSEVRLLSLQKNEIELEKSTPRRIRP